MGRTRMPQACDGWDASMKYQYACPQIELVYPYWIKPDVNLAALKA